ncbi:hypothetical protein GCM10009821_01660 [Aeromicrobium halocynthiae]|uniref:Alpha/beta hydrolase fold-3 domain-containing protein n=1 Tax=Aeromicrobium halocynthiae TaxID=560557 RepID=A0ABN2VQC9_9ACTN
MRLLRRWVDTVLVLAVAAAVVLLRRAMRLRAVHPDLRQPALLVAVPFRRWSLPVVRRVLVLSTPVVDGVVHHEALGPATPDGHRPRLEVHRPRSPDPDLASAVLLWLHDGGPGQVDPGRLVVAGASAGGGLAASLVHHLHDHGPVRPALQALVYPMLDDRTLPGSAARVPRPVWSSRSNWFGWQSLLGLEPGGDRSPEAAVPARRADLSSLPPTWIGVGDVDLFHDECVRHADRLVAAGVRTELVVAHGLYHGADAAKGDRVTLTREFRAAFHAAVRAALTEGPQRAARRRVRG